MTITASRTPQPLSESLAAVSVIDRADIEASGAPDLLELLRLEAGVDVARTGGPGQQTSVFLRGTNSNHVLVLIDGVRMGSPNTGAYPFEHVPLAHVERVEIVRGPRAAVWGSDAIGGVIQIFTRRDAGAGASASYGSFDAREVTARAAVQSADASAGVLAASRNVGGFSTQNDNGFAFDPDDDSYHNHSLSLWAGDALGKARWNVQLLGSDARVEFDQGVSFRDQQIVSASLGGPLIDQDQRTHYRINLGFQRETLRTPAFGSDFDSHRSSLDLLLDTRFDGQGNAQAATNGHWLVGLALERNVGASVNRLAGTQAYDATRDNAGIFSIGRYAWQTLQFDASARLDENSEFGSHFTWGLAAGWQFDSRWRAYASVGEAFRAPSLLEQFSPGFGGLFAGNADLNPEESQNRELGLERHGGRLSLRGSLFDNEIDQLISFSGPDFAAINVDQASIRGLELAAQWQTGPWRVSADLTLQDAKDGSGNALLRRPDEKMSLQLGRHFLNQTWRGALELFYSGARADITRELDDYTLLNVTANWRIAPQWQLNLRAENLLDEDYQLADGLNTAERSLFATLRWDY